MQTHLLLKKYFERKKKFAPGFSVRALAGRLDISPSFLSRVLSGKKAIPYPLLLRLGEALDIEPEVFSGLKEAHSSAADPGRVAVKGRKKLETSMEDWELASQESLRVLRHWYYLPMLEFTTLQSYDGKPVTIAGRLGISIGVAEAAMRELADLGLLELKGGRYLKTKKKLRWVAGKSVAEIRSFHDQMLTRAQLELRNGKTPEEFEQRLISGITFTANPIKIAAAKKRLAECLHEIVNDLTESPGSEVFHLSAQLFPLTKK
ncbi:MAG: TIGR02147 family protein [Bdellovibrionota bacterium]